MCDKRVDEQEKSMTETCKTKIKGLNTFLTDKHARELDEVTKELEERHSNAM